MTLCVPPGMCFEGVFETVTDKKRSDKQRARFCASCLVWRVVAAFSRVAHHRCHWTDVPLQPDSPLDSVCRIQQSLIGTMQNRHPLHLPHTPTLEERNAKPSRVELQDALVCKFNTPLCHLTQGRLELTQEGFGKQQHVNVRKKSWIYCGRWHQTCPPQSDYKTWLPCVVGQYPTIGS